MHQEATLIFSRSATGLSLPAAETVEDVFDLTALGEERADPAGVALERALRETADVYRTVWDSLPRSERQD